MGSANEYWHYARQCRELAVRTADEAHKEFMLAMAETWRRLATGDLPHTPANDDSRPQQTPAPVATAGPESA